MSRVVLILIFAIVFNALANILIKVGMVRIEDTSHFSGLIKGAIQQPALIAGVFSFVLALVAYSIVASFFILKEVITPLQIVGFLFIIAGVWMVAR